MVLLGCADLKEIRSGICGNGVVEGTEECDTFASSGQRCRAPEEAEPCRYDCSLTSDGQAECPQFSACGVDGVCRFSSGREGVQPTYEPWGSFVAMQAESVELGDLDGDGRQDLLTLGNFNSRWQALPQILFFDESGQATEAFDPQLPISSPVIADLDPAGLPEDRRQQLVFATDFGIATLQSSADRSVVPIANPFQVVPTAYRVLRIRGSSASPLGDGILLMFGDGMGQTAIMPANTLVHFATLPRALEDVTGDILAGDIVEGTDSPCEEALFTFRGDGRAYMVEPCDQSGAWREDSQTARVVVELDGEHTVGLGGLLALVNEDPHLDLLLGDEDGGVLVAFGNGHGTFMANPENPDGTLGQAWPVVLSPSDCFESPPSDTPPPLAVADLNGDSVSDWVTAVGILMASKVTVDADARRVSLEGCPGNTPFGGMWSVARVADLNGDSVPDVIAGSSTEPGLDFLAGTGRNFLNRINIGTGGPVTHLVVGDFDGDLTLDVGLGQSLQGEDAGQVAIAFGSKVGPPAAPVEVGRFDVVLQLQAGNYETEDAIDELGVISSDDPPWEALTVFVGNPGRHPIASLGLAQMHFGDEQGEEPGLEGVNAFPLACSVGRFTAGEPFGLLAVGADDPVTDEFQLRAWYARGSASAEFADVAPSLVLPSRIRAVSAATGVPSIAVVAGDLDQNAGDEGLILAAGSEEETLDLWQLRLPGDDGQWPEEEPAKRLSTGEGRLLSTSRPMLIDVDRKGGQDLALIVGDSDGQQRFGVVWNESGSLSLGDIVWADLDGQPAMGFDAVAGKSATRVVVVTEAATYDVTNDGRKLRVEPVEGLPGGRAIGLGDLTGDGLLDIVVSVQGGVHCLAEKAEQP